MPKYTTHDATASSNIELPRDRYTVRVQEVTLGRNEKWDCPTVALKCEILAPETVNGAVIRGKSFRPMPLFFLPTEDWGLAQAFAAIKAMGLGPKLADAGIDLDDETGEAGFDPTDKEVVTSIFKGHVFDVILSSEQTFQTKSGKMSNAKTPKDDYVLNSAGEKIPKGWAVVCQLTDACGAAEDLGAERFPA